MRALGVDDAAATEKWLYDDGTHLEDTEVCVLQLSDVIKNTHHSLRNDKLRLSGVQEKAVRNVCSFS